MGILVGFVGLQVLYDKWNKSNIKIFEKLNKKVVKDDVFFYKHKFKIKTTFVILIFGFVGSFFAQVLAKRLPEIKDIISTYAWIIIIVSTLGILLSFTKVKKLEHSGASKIGYFILYFVLTAIGARASIANLHATFIFILAGFFIVFVHAFFLLFASRIIKAPLFLVAVASQANIGGVASAPVVAAVYQPELASVGLLLAILGNIVGTYFGIISGQLCRFFI
jgi:uncharacterized membrane protein